MPILRKPNLTYAFNSNGDWVHVDNVPTGYACECTCPCCGSKLQAKNSRNNEFGRAHHFAHPKGSDCVGSDESYQHKIAKDILEECKVIVLPLIKGEAENRTLRFERVEKEFNDKETRLRPDCACYFEDKCIWVEFKRTHEVDTKKAEKIRAAKIDCIELDLRECSTDKKEIWKLITERTDNRIWIYNSATEQFLEREKKAHAQSVYIPHETQIIERHFAIDEEGMIVNICDLPANYQIEDHSFFCLNCNRPLTISENQFLHAVQSPCDDANYLREVLKRKLQSDFYNHNTLKVTIPRKAICKNHDTCPFYEETSCYQRVYEVEDLKKLGYGICDLNFRFPGENEKYDIVYRKNNSLREAVILNIETEDCIRDIETQRRCIILDVNTEEDIVHNVNSPLGSEFGSCVTGFDEISKKMSPFTKIGNEILKLSLYQSGKSFYGDVPCTELMKPRNAIAIAEYAFSGEYHDPDALECMALEQCYKSEKQACFCKICAYLKQSNGYSKPLCIRYKRQGTPKNPLDTRPVNCQHFRLDYEKLAELHERFKSVKLFEITSEGVRRIQE